MPQNTASNVVGIIRGFSKNENICYVEPRALVNSGNELDETQAKIVQLENEILQHLSQTIASAAPFIECGFDIVARIDVILARAAYGVTMNGSIPYIGTDGQIQIDGFVHPLLAHKQAYYKGSQTSSQSVVPVDLKISGESNCHSLIISGPNGGMSLCISSSGD